MAEKKRLKDKTDRRYRAKVRVGMDAEGKPIYKWASGSTKAELEKAKKDLMGRFLSGEDAAKLTVGEYVQKWYAARVAGLSPSTARNIASRLNAVILPAIGGRFIRTVATADLLEILEEEKARSRSQGTLAFLAGTLREIFAAAHADGTILTNPAHALKAPASVKEAKERRALTEAEREAVLYVGISEPEGLYLLVLYFLGLRKSEALGLQWGDIDWDNAEVKISRDIDYKADKEHLVGKVKTRTSNRTVPIPAPLLAVLRQRRAIGWVFHGAGGRPMGTTAFRGMWRRLMTASARYRPEIEQRDGASILTPHYLRHDYGTRCIKAGINPQQVQEWMGHSSIQVTMDVYSHLDQERRQTARELLDRSITWQPFGN